MIVLLTEVILMRVTIKGQVTIPIEVREKLGILPGTEVEFVVSGDAAKLVKSRKKKNGSRQTPAKKAIGLMTGKGSVEMSTAEIMELTRGWGEDDDID